jgi:hypothetical protein
MKNKITKVAFVLLTTVMLSTCDKFSTTETDLFEETEKDLSGVWKLRKVTRNGIDITTLMDFSQFSLDLKEDGEYVIGNYLPFVVKNAGKWNVDDPLYPFHLIFEEEGGNTEEVSVEIEYMIVNGKRSLSIEHSPGCFSNSYTYVFDRTDNE